MIGPFDPTEDRLQIRLQRFPEDVTALPKVRIEVDFAQMRDMNVMTCGAGLCGVGFGAPRDRDVAAG